MTKTQHVPVGTRRVLGTALAGLVLALGLLIPTSVWAVGCPAVDTLRDADQDGFTDDQECNGIWTLGTLPKFFPYCGSAEAAGLGRDQCVDPDSRDLFVIFRPASSGSLLTGNPNLPPGFPFAPVQFSCLRTDGTSWCGGAGTLRYDGFSALGIATHQLTPEQAASDRTVASGSTQKAVRVSESLDTSSTVVLGHCSWGTPLGLDGCTIYTKRTKNFIDSKCNLAKDTTATNRNHVFVAYVTFLAVHEGGHTLGGLTSVSDPNLGGYHYASTSNSIMAQAAEYSTQGKKCTWYIPTDWNMTLDLPAVNLINR